MRLLSMRVSKSVDETPPLLAAAANDDEELAFEAPTAEVIDGLKLATLRFMFFVFLICSIE